MLITINVNNGPIISLNEVLTNRQNFWQTVPKIKILDVCNFQNMRKKKCLNSWVKKLLCVGFFLVLFFVTISSDIIHTTFGNVLDQFSNNFDEIS